MEQEVKKYRNKKIVLTVLHILFVLAAAAGFSAMYLSSDFGKGISWLRSVDYEDTEQFHILLSEDIDKIFTYIGYKDVFETDGELDLNKVIVGVNDGPGLDEVLTLDDIIKESRDEVPEDSASEGQTEDNSTKTASGTEEPQTEAEKSDGDKKEEEKTSIYYVTDEVQQSQYINMFKAQGQDAIILTHNIDSAFVTYLEQKHPDIQFLRIDADVHESLKDEVAEDEKESFQKAADSLVEIFRKELNNDKLNVKVEKLKDDKVASMAVLSEQERRMAEMMKMYGMGGMDPSMFGSQATLVLNANHPLVQFLVEHKRSKNVPIICKQLYDLAMLAHKPLSPEEMTAFVQRSNEIMMLLTK